MLWKISKNGVRKMMNEIIHVPFFSSKECCDCIEYAHKKEKELKKLNIKYKPTHGEGKITTNLYNEYNFFNDNPQYVKKLKKIIQPIFNAVDYPLFFQSWVNIYRKNDNIQWHKHNFSDAYTFGFTANIFLGGNPDIGLTYAIHDEKLPRYHYKHIKNKLGYVMIFPNHIFHMVRKNPCDKIRYTVGITISHYNSELGKIFASSDCSNLLVISSPHTDTNKNISYQ